jgi:arylsulfatase A-like enzyme
LGTTPALAKLASQSTLVEQAYAVLPHTSQSLVAILCGFEPRIHPTLSEAGPAGLPGTCLPRLLRDQGYDTAFFQAASKNYESRERLVTNLGFETLVAAEDLVAGQLERVNYFGYEDAILLEPSERWLAARQGRPFLATYLTNASHHPYGAPKTWPRRPFAPEGARNNYLNSMSYVDAVVGKLIDQYARAGLLDRTLLVVLGDHGEGFDEHGMSTHDNILYEEGVRVPLLFRPPAGQQRPPRISGPVNHLAVVPTVLDVLGFEPVDGQYMGDSVYRQSRQDPLYFACLFAGRCLGMLADNHKLIFNYTNRPPQLFNLQADPAERIDIARQQPDRVAAWLKQLSQWESAVDNLHTFGCGGGAPP